MKSSVQPTLTKILSLLLLGTLSATAQAKVKLPGGKVIPDPAITCQSGKPGGLAAVFACSCTAPNICNIGKPCPGGSTSCDPGNNGTCETTIWHKVNDDPCIPTYRKGLDPVNDATVKPETFQPACGRTFSLITRGNAMFKNGFGWYNVVKGKKPAASDLYTLVDCNTVAGTKTTFDLLKDPRYKGGDVGFFLVTPESLTTAGSCASGGCCASVARATKGEGRIYYSQPTYNPDNTGSGDYVHLLLYTSKIFSHSFYFTWEDTFKGTSTDYSDFVTLVSGISCSGAGAACNTGKQGICGMGVTVCDSVGQLVCQGANTAQKEQCDGLDNNCNGTVDDNAVCPPNKVCHQGACVPKCTASTEFPCPPQYECDKSTGLCVSKLCKGITCKPGEICLLGKCGDGCSGVVCPPGQFCQVGMCVDPCKGLTCTTGNICKLGVCVPNCTLCGGVTCKLPLACNQTTGDCHDPSCKPACAAGTYCKGGKCVGLCDGVVCPGNMTCVNGTCPPPGTPTIKSITDSGSTDFFSWPTDAAAPGADTGSKQDDGFDDDGCSLGGSQLSLGLAWPLLMLLCFGIYRRRS